jgi:hypothetical protein
MSSLRTQIESLALAFAERTLTAVRGSSLDQILDLKGTRPRGRPKGSTSSKPRGQGRKKRTSLEIKQAADAIIAFVRKHPKGVPAPTIKMALGIPQKEWMFPLAVALKQGLKKSGKKRATVYFAA